MVLLEDTEFMRMSELNRYRHKSEYKVKNKKKSAETICTITFNILFVRSKDRANINKLSKWLSIDLRSL